MAHDRRGPLERYLAILEIVAASHRGLTLTELAVLSNLPKATIHRLVNTLQATGALQLADDRQKTFHIGERMWKILHLGRNEQVVANFAQIICDELADKTGETCFLVKLGHDSVNTVARSVPDQGYRLHVLPGKELPCHAASSAKAILAYQPTGVLGRYLREPLLQLSDRTKTNIKQVKAELEWVRQHGYAVCDGEIDNNIMAYSCPIRIPEAGVLYSIGVTGSGDHINKSPADYWVGILQAAAERFTIMLSVCEP